MSDSQVTNDQSVETEQFPIERSTLYARWQEERRHILTNAWYLSERLGRDCGWDHARWDWDMRHRQRWLREWEEQQAAGQPA